MRAVIIDDESHIHAIVRKFLESDSKGIEIVGNAFSVNEAHTLVQKEQPDLLFLDINMEDGTGFDLLRLLGQNCPQVIFITAYNHFAVQAFQFNAVDYLLKPLDYDLFVNAIEKVSQQNTLNHMQEQLQMLTHALQQKRLGKKIILRDTESVHFIETDEILYCRAEGSYTTFFLHNGQNVVVSKNLKEYETLLGEYGFMRIHRSYLINCRQISKYDKAEGNLVLKGGVSVPVSIKKEQLNQILSWQ
jgi:two-component system LytT family response regulator